MSKILKFKLQTISPVHISSGEELDPFTYIIKADKTGNKRLYYINLYNFIALLNEDNRETLTQMLTETKVNKAMCNAIAFINQIFNEEQHIKAVLKSYPVNNSLYDEYLLRLQNFSITGFKINTSIKDGNFIPYLPGSSIKGMVKRAFIFKQDFNGYSNEFQKIEKKKQIEIDPFKMLKISDSYSNNAELNIGYVRDFALNTLSIESDRINVTAEFIKPGTVFDIEMVVNTNFNMANIFRADIFKSEFKNEDNVLSFLNNYFIRLLQNEIKLFSEDGKNKSNEFIQLHDSIKKEYGDKVAFINIGKYGGKLVKVNNKDEKNIYARRYYTDKVEKLSSYTCSQVMPIGWVALYYE